MDYLADKGLMAKNTAAARKAAANKVLGVLDENEASDILAVDLNDVMTRFQNLEGKKYTPGSLSTYRSRTKAALDDFESYLENPMGFRPKLQSREPKQKTLRAEGGNLSVEPGKAKMDHVARSAAVPPAVDKIMPIPLRQDLTVYIQGLPFDLTEAEARKIANVVLAMANPSS